MATNREKRKLILQRVGACFIIMVCAAGAWFYVQYEINRSRDAQTLARIVEFQSILASYWAHHGAYPSMGQESRVLGDRGAECLSSDGFVNVNSDSCRQRSFGFFGPIPDNGKSQFAQYTSFAADGATLCTNQNGCQSYKIEFFLETNSIASKGIHSVSHMGLQ